VISRSGVGASGPDQLVDLLSVDSLSVDSGTADIAAPARGGAPRGGGTSFRTLRRVFAFFGPGYLVATGYMDPGNWATDLSGGSTFGYTLLSVVLLSSLMAMLLQHLAIRLGVATGLDLAQACRARFSKGACLLLWVLCEIAICACDLAELIGTAIAIQLLFGVPLVAGIAVTAFDCLLVLALERWGFRPIEAFVAAVLAGVTICFAVELWAVSPDWGEAARAIAPRPQILSDPKMLYIAIGILGATVMPHNLYLHSSLAKSRGVPKTWRGRRASIRLFSLDSCLALSLALAINAAILILAAAAFHGSQTVVDEIQDAYALLAPTVGWSLAPPGFAVAHHASGQNSTITATMAGQIVMEGFLDLRLPPFWRRLVTRGLAIIPAMIVVSMSGDHGVSRLLVLSQVILSVQLPFAAAPLVFFTSDQKFMNGHATGPWLKAISLGIVCVILALNAMLVWQTVSG
jgi:manganese transport protein